MGTAMAKRLLDAGIGLSVTNRTRSKAEALSQYGAVVANRPVELAACDVVFTMVSADSELMEVTTGEGGALKGADAPGVIVDCSTVSAATSADVRASCAARGTEFLAAPVSGNPRVVAQGQLTLAVSGSRSTFERVRSTLELLGRGVTYVGEGESARMVKLCHNVLLGVVAETLAEVTVLAESAGVSRRAFLQFINDSVLGSPFSRYKTPAFVGLDFRPTFTTALLAKDLRLALEASRSVGVVMPVAALTAELVSSASDAGFADLDFAALVLQAARRSGRELVAESVDVDDGLT